MKFSPSSQQFNHFSNMAKDSALLPTLLPYLYHETTRKEHVIMNDFFFYLSKQEM